MEVTPLDIAALSTLKSQAQLQLDVGMSVMKKAMDTAEQNASLVNQMLDRVDQGKNAPEAKLPGVGNNVDIHV
ncbi:MAG: YjfB family protein [Desulfotomaculum sp.]|nr:YjfB family protein [Desulfotomaculum sp.]